MSFSLTGQGGGVWQSSFTFGLVVTAFAIVILKMATGLALMPLAILGLVVFAFAVAFRLRVLRSSAAGRSRGSEISPHQ